ncbi:putative phosphoribosyltransferase [Encephalitozoon hellem]|nr:putative phosphoribosyltransferase [Encephalitozoon hellem]
MESWKLLAYFLVFAARAVKPRKEKLMSVEKAGALMEKHCVRAGGPMDLRLGIMGCKVNAEKNGLVWLANGQVPLTRDRFRAGSGWSVYEEISSPEYDEVRGELLAVLMGLSLGSKVGEKWKLDGNGRARKVVITVGGSEDRAEKGLGVTFKARINSRILKFVREITGYFGRSFECFGYVDSDLLPLHITLARALGDDENAWSRFFLLVREGIEGNEVAMKRCFVAEGDEENEGSERAKAEIEALWRLYEGKGFAEKLTDENLFAIIFMESGSEKDRVKAVRMLCRYLKECGGRDGDLRRKEDAEMLMRNMLREIHKNSAKEWARMVRMVCSYKVPKVIPCETGLSAVEAEMSIYESIGGVEDGSYIIDRFFKGLRNEWNCSSDGDRNSVWRRGMSMIARLVKICGDDVYYALKREEIRLGVAGDLWKSRCEGGKMIKEMIKSVVCSISLESGKSVEDVEKLLKSRKSRFIQKEFMNFYVVRNNGIKLAHRIYKEGFIPDVIYVALRGGAYLGNVVSEYFNAVCGRKIPYAAVSVHSYTDVGENSSVQVEGWIHHPSKLKKGSKVLFVDDILDSGKTINRLAEIILNEGIPRSDLKIAVHDYKCFPDSEKKNAILPDYWCRRQDVSVWDGPRWIDYSLYELIGTSKEEFEEQYYTRDPELREALKEITK